MRRPGGDRALNVILEGERTIHAGRRNDLRPEYIIPAAARAAEAHITRGRRSHLMKGRQVATTFRAAHTAVRFRRRPLTRPFGAGCAAKARTVLPARVFLPGPDVALPGAPISCRREPAPKASSSQNEGLNRRFLTQIPGPRVHIVKHRHRKESSRDFGGHQRRISYACWPRCRGGEPGQEFSS